MRGVWICLILLSLGAIALPPMISWKSTPAVVGLGMSVMGLMDAIEEEKDDLR